jgi:drug/metabolite transporter (DMT)-like permease
MTIAKVLGVLLGIFGVAVIFSDQLIIGGTMALLGSVALVLSAFFGSYGNVLVKTYGGKIDPMVLAAGQMIFGFVPLLAIGFTTEGNPLKFNWTIWPVISLLYLVVVGSVIAFALYYWLMRNMQVTKTMLIALVVPVVAVVLGMIALHEEFNWSLLGGGACIISGLGLIVLRKRHKRVPTAEEAPELITQP